MEAIKRILMDSDRKSISSILFDFIKLFKEHRNYKCFVSYGNNLIYKRNAGKLQDYIDHQAMRKIINNYYVKTVDHRLKNKIHFHEFLHQNNLSYTSYIGKIQEGIFYTLENDEYIINTAKELEPYIRILLEKHPVIFIKPAEGAGGKNILIINKNNLDEISLIDLNTDYILEEQIQQNKKITEIYAEGVNILRVITIRQGNNIVFPCSYLAVGRGSNKIVNANVGSLLIGYDIQTNKLEDVAYTKFKFGGHSFFKHPETDYEFKGGELIFNERVMEMLTKVALLFDRDLIGFDVAYTPKGPCIVEANSTPNLESMQIFSKGLFSKPHFKNLFQKFL